MPVIVSTFNTQFQGILDQRLTAARVILRCRASAETPPLAFKAVRKPGSTLSFAFALMKLLLFHR